MNKPAENPVLPPGLDIRQVLTWRASQFQCVAWSPDGRHVAAGAPDGCLWLFDVSNGENRLVEGHTDSVRSVAWSPDGRTLASGSDDSSVRIWDAATGNNLHILQGHTRLVTSVAWSPDGRTLASGSHDNTILIWDSTIGTNLRTLHGHKDWVRSVAWSPDGSELASGSADKTVCIWEPVTGKNLRTLRGHTYSVTSVAWSPDGRRLASGSYEKAIWIWDAVTGKTLRTLEGHTGLVASVVWSPDGRALASGSYDKSIRIWNPVTGDNHCTLQGHTHLVASVAWSPDGRALASGSSDKTIRIWNPATGDSLRILQGHTHSLTSLAWSPDAHSLASGSYNNSVQIWDTVSGKNLRSLKGHAHSVISVAWSPDGSALAFGSYDNTIQIWDISTGKTRRILQGHTGSVRSVAWSPDGHSLASGSDDKTVRIWDLATGQPLHTLAGHANWVRSVAWSPDGHLLASGSYDNTIRIWDIGIGKTKRILEGHHATVTALAWFYDSSFVASCAENGELRLWRMSDGQLVAEREPLSYHHWPVALLFGDAPLLPDRLGETEVFARLWRPGPSVALAPQISITSAKVVLVGDSDVGKSCLALRLAEDRFEQQGTTHGMQIWTLPAEKLHPSAKPPAGEQREVFLWDLGGQAEYQLVHQLFLHDTTAALVLFDATRDKAKYEAAEDWNRRLEMQARGRKISKLLVRSKLDLEGVVDHRRVKQLEEQCHFAGYHEVSAQSGVGVDRLREDINATLAWEDMAKISRPASYQSIRETIQEERKRTAIVFHSELEKRLGDGTKDLDTVLGQLALEGQMVDVRLAQGDRVLVLRIDALSRYAGSLILAAREQPRGVPMLEPHRILSADMRFPGMKDDERLGRFAERVVVECAVQLLLERGICLEHAGILVFPTLFSQAVAAVDDRLPHPRPLYYDFDGPIDNIYAALVARLAMSGEFGGVRLWSDRAEYEQSGKGVFGIGRKDRSRGRGHLDLYCSNEVNAEQRELFTRFVEDHLRNQGVEVLEGLAFDCECGEFKFNEGLLRGRLERGENDVKCPACERTYPMFRAIAEPQELADRLHALKTETERRGRQVIAEVKRTMASGAGGLAADSPILLLHLSDLHLTGDRSVEQLLEPLNADLRELKAGKLDYLVVSGDLADKCNPAGFERAAEFLEALMKRFSLNASRLIIVPGNHDLDRNRSVYDLELDEKKALGTAADARVRKDDVYLIRNDTEYPKRFDLFRNCYKGLTQADYPEQHERQGLVIAYPDDGIEFLTLNSAWLIDRFHPERISIDSSALSKALLETEPDMKLRIVVWHHAVSGIRQVANQENIKRLSKAGYRLCLHGDVHEQRNDLLNHLDRKRSLHVVGAGSFASPDPGLPYATPRLYNLLQIDRQFCGIRVRTRAQKSIDGAFEPYAIYPADDPGARRGDYWIDLRLHDPF